MTPLTITDNIRIILVEPQHPGNIGATARAMKTMGLNSLILVKPNRFPDPQADWRAAGAVDLLENAKIFQSLDESLSDCGFVAGTSVRERHISLPTYTPDVLARNVVEKVSSEIPVGILFGRETNGLTNDELLRCQVQVRIPSHETYPSLNVAMAVQIISYEIFQLMLGVTKCEKPDENWSSAYELNGFYDHLESVLDQVDFLNTNNTVNTMRKFKRLFNRRCMDRTEVAMLRGVLSHIERMLRKKNSEITDV